MNNIKDARQLAGLTQQAMADLFGIPKRTIENWEAGLRKPPMYVEKLIVEKLEGLLLKNTIENREDIINKIKSASNDVERRYAIALLIEWDRGFEERKKAIDSHSYK